MIGQDKLLKDIDRLIEQDLFPRFSIIVGEKGSGKKMLAKHIADTLKARKILLQEPKVAEVRDIIAQSNKLGKRTCYILADSDTISVNAKNALLKIAEEPPRDCYIIMTLADINNTLDTIKSRAQIFNMQPYAMIDIEFFCGMMDDEEKDIVVDLCSTPGEVEQLKEQGIKEFYEYVEKVYGSIATVSGANSFKIANKLALKDDKGYDLKLFWKAFIRVCMSDTEHKEDNCKAEQITSRALQDLRIKGINKEGLFDMWILDIRKEWM